MVDFNIFEGSRRIALLLKVLVGACGLFITFLQTPYVRLQYDTHGPDQPFVLTTGSCDVFNDASEYITRSLANGQEVSVALCFRAQSFESSQQKLVPYKSEGGQIWGNSESSADVTAYAKRRAENFRLSIADQKAAQSELSRQRWTSYRNGALYTIGAVIALTTLQLLIGWIVRGFLGIPWRHDRRPGNAATS
ncbi:MAG TPA: hypothetical protein VKB50_27820 [Vicinamibacterales bacterium]|nr:hypothetical protein [Vicinamibacterales bacterium]